MLYIRFLNLQNPLQDVEQLYKDGTIKQGDIVCQQYTDKYSRLFMNGTWVKTKYISKIAQNTEVEDDVKTLYDSIVNTSTMLNDTSIRLNNVSTRLDNSSTRLNDVSTRLNDTSARLLNYLTINQYLKDEELIASTFADLNNKINNVGNIDFSNYYNIDQINEKISNINTSTNDISNNLSNTSIRLNNVSTRLNNLYTNTQIDTFISNLNTSITNVSNNVKTVSGKVNEVSTRLNDTSVRLLNYLTINQYLKDENLIASTFADVNNKINSLYAEIAELKEQLKSSTK